MQPLWAKETSFETFKIFTKPKLLNDILCITSWIIITVHSSCKAIIWPQDYFYSAFIVLFAARHVNTCISYTCKFLNPFVIHRENNIILDWNDVGVSKPWSFYSLVIIVLIIARFGWKTWALWAWPSVKWTPQSHWPFACPPLMLCCSF